MDQAIFLRWKNVRTQIQIVARVINQLEWKHRSKRIVISGGEQYVEAFEEVERVLPSLNDATDIRHVGRDRADGFAPCAVGSRRCLRRRMRQSLLPDIGTQNNGDAGFGALSRH